MKRRQKTESESRIKTMLMIMAFIAMMFVLATYAWFSTQRNVSITNIEGIVNVAEGLDISLDAETWGSTIDLSQANLLEHMTKEELAASEEYAYSAYDGNTNVKPSELLPVSTLGTPGSKIVNMYRGTNSGTSLRNLVLCNETEETSTEPEYPGYFAFDIFLRDSSRESGDNALYLTTDSNLTVKASGDDSEEDATDFTQYGLQNTVRVAFAKFSGTSDYSDNGATAIANTTGESSKINQVSIWEPNSNFHVDTIVSSNNSLKVPQSMESQLVAGKFERNSKIDTFALVDDATKFNTSNFGEYLFTNKETDIYGIKDVYNWKIDSYAQSKNPFDLQRTVKTKITVPDEGLPEDYQMTEDSYTQMYGSDTTGVALTDTSSAENSFTITGNTITRVRVYIWLEGQDVDTINYASHGGGISLSMGLQK